jgi:hypothetical protein
VDAVTLDGLLAELRPRLLGQYLGRIRAAAAHALVAELSRGDRLWCDASRETPGLYLLNRETARGLADEAEAAGRTRQALLHARKHLEGARVSRLERVPGSRTLTLEAGPAVLVLRMGGAAPAAALAVEGAPVAVFGEGPPAWPPPDAEPDREWDRVARERFERDVEEARARGWSDVRAHAAACPALGPALARLVASGQVSFDALRARLAAPVPTLVAPGPPAECADADLAGRGAVRLLPLAPPDPGGRVIHPAGWVEAAAAFLGARLRGLRFAGRQRRRLDEAGRRIQRLQQLEARLLDDRAGLPSAAELRRGGEALLAHGGTVPPGAERVEVPDPYDPDRVLRIAVDPRLTAPMNANRLFDRARRVDRAQRHLEQRLEAARADIEAARRDEASARAARNASDLAAAEPRAARRPPAAAGGPRRFLTTRGLELVAGRGARENQQVTFDLAGPEDWWLHARDVPGAHVVLRDPQGRASEEDLREAAEVAAFFSEARTEAQADVHAARRKHVRPAGGPGRVRVLHSDTLRVRPRDPEGRLRRR